MAVSDFDGAAEGAGEEALADADVGHSGGTEHDAFDVGFGQQRQQVLGESGVPSSSSHNVLVKVS